MDLRVYYQNIRSKEAEIAEEFPVVVSNQTEDGGKEGRYAEVTRAIAAKMVIDGVARLAVEDEARVYREKLAAAKKAADEAVAAAKVQFTVVSTADMAKLSALRKEKA